MLEHEGVGNGPRDIRRGFPDRNRTLEVGQILIEETETCVESDGGGKQSDDPSAADHELSLIEEHTKEEEAGVIGEHDGIRDDRGSVIGSVDGFYHQHRNGH